MRTGRRCTRGVSSSPTSRTRDVVGKLFDTLAPRFAERPGGYTRILRVGYRRGDAAEVAQVELVGSEYNPAAKAEKEDGEGEDAPKKAKGVGERLKRAAAAHSRRQGRGRLKGAGRRADARQGAEEHDTAQSRRFVEVQVTQGEVRAAVAAALSEFVIRRFLDFFRDDLTPFRLVGGDDLGLLHVGHFFVVGILHVIRAATAGG